MGKHAAEPLCPFCKEDRPAMVTKVVIGNAHVWNCAVCGKAWMVGQEPADETKP